MTNALLQDKFCVLIAQSYALPVDMVRGAVNRTNSVDMVLKIIDGTKENVRDRETQLKELANGN